MSVKSENELLKMVIETQASRIKEQEETIKELRSIIDELHSVTANLEETIAEFKRQFFGVKSEKTSKKEEPAEADDKKESIQVKSHTRERKPKATRDELYANLPVKEIICPVPEEERICDWCNAEMIPTKPTFVREELRITPAVVERVRYMQEVLICPECKQDQIGTFKKGEVPSALIPHSPASASAVAFVMFNKCFMGLPYYRQESAFTQLGAKIPRETLANWCIIAAQKYLFPIYDLIHSELIKREVIHADELCSAIHNSSACVTGSFKSSAFIRST